MKIQSIDNQNISHKAYFKPNTEFKKLWAVRPQNDENYFNQLRRVKKELPNHQLEIIDSFGSLIDEIPSKCYLIFNNITNKAFGLAIAATSTKNHLVEVFDSLLEKNEKTTDFFTPNWDSSEFENITTKNF